MFDFQVALNWAYAELRTHYPSLHPHCWYDPCTNSNWGRVTIHLCSVQHVVKTAELEWEDGLLVLSTVDMATTVAVQELV